MNWEMLAAMGQPAAVVIGIPSVIYLALQIRGQTKERQRPSGAHLLSDTRASAKPLRRSRSQSLVGDQPFEHQVGDPGGGLFHFAAFAQFLGAEAVGQE